MTKIAAKPAEAGKEPLRTVKKRQNRKKPHVHEKNTEAIPAFDWAGVELKEFRKSFVDVSAYNTASRKYNEESLRKYYNEAEARTLITTPPSADPAAAPTPAPLKPPMVTFTQTPFPAPIHTELKRQGFDKPHPIFAITWPHILSGQNFTGVAQSGPWSLGYVLPCLVHVNDQVVKAKGVELKPEEHGPIAVVVTHSQTRGEQLLEQFQKFGALLNVTSHLLYGDKDDKADDPHVVGLQENPNVVIAACGSKLTELVAKKKLNLKRCTFLVFDDATLLTKFVRTVENVLGQVRPDRQLVMWNTTFGSSNGNAQEVIRQAKKFNFVEYTRVFFGTYGHFFNPNTIKHVVDFFIPDGERDLRFMLTIQTVLTASAASGKKPHILVFCNTLAKSRKAADALQRTGILSKAFQTKNPIPHPVSEKPAAPRETKPTKPETKPVDKPEDSQKEEGGDESVTEEKPANAEPVTFEQQLEINQREFSENKLYQIWIANDANPLAELDFSEFDCIVQYDFPARPELFKERAAKFLEEAGHGTIYTLLLESCDHKAAKYLSDYLLEHNQYCSPRLAVDVNQRSKAKPADAAPKPVADATKGKQPVQQNAVKKPTVQTKVMGKPVPNRPPSLLQRQNRANGPYNRPFVGAGGGGPGFGARNGGRFGPGGPGGPNNFGPGPFGGNNRQNFNRGGGGGNFGPGNQPNMMDALNLLNQLRNGNGGGNDDGFYNRRSDKQDNFNNDFGGNFGGNRGNSFNNGPRNNFGGDGGNGGNGWFKEGGQNRNFNNWNRNF